MTTNYCPECLVNWAGYMTDEGCCPQCGGGTLRRQEPMSDEAVDLHHAALRARFVSEKAAHAHAEFEAFYAEREARRLAEDVYADLASLPVVQPAYSPRRAA